MIFKFKKNDIFCFLFCLYFTLSKNLVLLRKCVNVWISTFIRIRVIVSKPGYVPKTLGTKRTQTQVTPERLELNLDCSRYYE